MYTFRFNPVFSRWVLLGTAFPESLRISPGHIILGSKDKQFFSATHPRQPFLLDPADRSRPVSKDSMYLDQPAVGEYELVLYQGKKGIFKWEQDEWSRWLATVQQRIIQLHHNPHLHHLCVSLDTARAGSVENYTLAGEIIATSHPVAGETAALSRELAAKITAKEELYVVAEDESGRLRAPSAPLHSHELWYVPAEFRAGFESVPSKELLAVAASLASAMKALRAEFPNDEFRLQLHSSLVGESTSTWWIQLYASNGVPALAAVPFPEKMVRDLR